MNIEKLKQAVMDKQILMWNDPDPIKGNDYIITNIEDLNKKCFDDGEFDEHTSILIRYGGGSEAEVYLHEILTQKL